jgi:replicative DNA helicase
MNAAIAQKKTVAFFSLEMTSEQLVDRILSWMATVNMGKIARGDLSGEDFARIGDSIEKLWETDIYLDDSWGTTIASLKSKLRRLKVEKGKLDMVVLDYLQLMSAGWSKFAGNRVMEVSEMSRSLKEMAKDLKVPIVVLSQLSRAVEQRVDKEPQLSDLRDSGAIEQDADSVMMIYREEYYDPDTDKKGATNIFVRKNRNWPIGDTELFFQKENMKFIELQ